MPRRAAPVSRLLPALALVSLLLGGAFAEGDDLAANATDAEAREALRAFATAWKTKSAEARIEAVGALGQTVHPDVAARLLKTAKRVDDDAVLTAIYRALAKQVTAGSKIAGRIERVLRGEAEAAAKRLRKGELGFRLDPRTGEADVDSEEGQRILAETESRGRRTAALLAAYLAISKEVPDDPEDFGVFLQDPLDDLVIATIGAYARWGTREAYLPLLELFRMYPDEYRYETGAVHHAGGTDASARAEWMARFGHPGKRRHRPEVYQALQTALETMTGKPQETPEALEAWMASRGMQTSR